MIVWCDSNPKLSAKCWVLCVQEANKNANRTNLVGMHDRRGQSNSTGISLHPRPPCATVLLAEPENGTSTSGTYAHAGKGATCILFCFLQLIFRDFLWLAGLRRVEWFGGLHVKPRVWGFPSAPAGAPKLFQTTAQLL